MFQGLKELDWKPFLCRWGYILLLGLLGAGVCLFLRSPLNSIAEAWSKFLAALPWYGQLLSLSLPTLGLLLLLRKGGAVRWQRRRLCTALRYPPTWFAAMLGGAIFIGLTWAEVSREGRLIDITGWELLSGSIVLTTFMAYLISHLGSSSAEKVTNPRTTQVSGEAKTSLNELLNDSVKRRQWLDEDQPISGPDEDLFGRQGIADQLARILREQKLQTIGLLGPYGSGKSSILKLVERNLKSGAKEHEARFGPDIVCDWFPPARIVTCTVCGWGLQAGSAAEHILEQVIEALSRRVDTLALTYLPNRYSAVLSNIPSQWGRLVLSLLWSWQTPESLLQRLDGVLAAAGLRLIVVLEDLDRNEREDKFWDEVGGLLDRLKDRKHISFIVACGLSEEKDSALNFRLFKHIEAIPPLPTEATRDLVRKVLEEDAAPISGKDIDPWEREERDKRLRLSHDLGIILEIDSRDRKNYAPSTAILRLLSCPRLLKLVLRHTLDTWKTLHGEIDREDIFLVTLLRLAAPEAYRFIWDHLRQLRGASQGAFPTIHEREPAVKVREAFDQAVPPAPPWDKTAAYSLLGVLFPGIKDWSSSSLVPPQGIALAYPIDYWDRLHAGRIPTGEVHDQTVLNAIETWRADAAAPVHEGQTLPAALLNVAGFAPILDHFGNRLTGAEVRRLASALLELIRLQLGQQGPDVKFNLLGSYPGYTVLWRLRHNKSVEGHWEWLLGELRKLLPLDLGLTNELLHDWQNDAEIAVTRQMQDSELLRQFVQAVREEYENRPDLLVCVLEKSSPGSVARLVNNKGRQSELTLDSYRDWQWLGQTLAEAVPRAPEIIVPQIAALLAKGDQLGNGTYRWQLLFDVAERFFPGGLPQATKLLTWEFDISGFDEQTQGMLTTVRQQPQEWLAANPPPVPPAAPAPSS